MTLLALNALRTGEVLSRDIDDLTYDFGHLVLELACKGGKRSTEALAPATARALEAYIGKRTSGPIFLDRKGGRTTEPTPGPGAAPRPPSRPPRRQSVEPSQPAPQRHHRRPQRRRAVPGRAGLLPATPIPAPPAATTAPATASIATPPMH